MMKVVSIGPPQGPTRGQAHGDHLNDISGGVGQKPENGLGFGMSKCLEGEHRRKEAKGKGTTVTQEKAAPWPIEGKQRGNGSNRVRHRRARKGKDGKGYQRETKCEPVGPINEVESLRDRPKEHQE